jgi:triosephosphate isomerase
LALYSIAGEIIMRQILVAGNWKLNGSQAMIEILIGGIKKGMDQVTQSEVAICPPFVYLSLVQERLAGSIIVLGAQDVCDEDAGAFTGEVSAPMLREMGCRYVIVGHSERRNIYGESDEFTARKFAATKRAGLIPILCVGELLEEREQGITEEVVARQLDAVLELEGVTGFNDAVVAYEPVWAIGTGKTATPQQAQDVHAFIRQRISQQDQTIAEKLRILYGGSVKGSNAEELFAKEDIDGGLIGGASLKAEEFLAICKSA